MFIEQIELKNFRNFNLENIIFSNRLNYIYGKNGQGKTNLLESLYILINGKSFRKAKKIDILNYGKTETIIKANVKNNISYEIKIKIDEKQKKTYINDHLIYNSKKIIPLTGILLSSDVLFYFKNSLKYRINIIDRFCYYYYGFEFLEAYKKMNHAKKNIHIIHESNKRFWIDIYKNHARAVNQKRINFFQDIKVTYEKFRQVLGINDLRINLKDDYNKNPEIYFSRFDKKDLSLGELKSVLFCLFISVIKTQQENKYILFVDDFHSEWDNITLNKSIETLISLGSQVFITGYEKTNSLPGFYIEKGVIQKT